MLSFIRRCRAPLLLSNYSIFPLLSTELSSISAAANLSVDDDPITDSPAPNPIGEVTARLRTFGLKEFVGSGYSILSGLNQFQVDSIVYDLKSEGPDLVFGFFNLLRDEYRFRHSRFSWLLVSHVLAGDRRFQQLGSVLQALLEEEGPGSAPRLCETLSLNFLDWTSNGVVWDALSFAYSRKEMVTDARFVLDTMKSFNIQPSVPTYNILLHNLRHTDTMWEVYNELKQTGPPTSEYTDSIVLDGLCKQSKWQEAVSFIFEKEQVMHSVVSFNTIMSGFCRMGFLDVAQSIFCPMLKYGLPPDVYSYNILIHGLFIAGLMEDALGLAYDMERNGIWPDLVTYNVLLKGFQLLGPIDGAWRLLDKILLDGLNPNLVSCLIIDFLCKNGRVLDAWSFLHEMESAGLSSYSVIYPVLIHWLCRHGETQKAMALYQHMTPKDTLAQSSLLSSLPLPQSRKFFETLRRTNPVEEIVFYNILIDRFVKTGNTEAAVILYGQILTRGIAPTVVTLNSLIYGFCRDSRLSEARTWFDAIESSTGENPSSISYTILMNAYGNTETIMELFEEMKAKNVAFTFVTYTVIIKGLCKELRLQESIQRLKEMYDTGLKPDQITYNIIIHCALKVKDIKQALYLYSEMISCELYPTPATHNVLINGLCLERDLHLADKFFDSIQGTGISKIAYMTLIKAHCAKGSVSKARKYFSEMIDMGFELSIRDYSAVINRLCKRCYVYEAKRVFYQMLCDGVLPDHQMCEIMMNGFLRYGDRESRVWLVGKMIKFGYLLPD